MRSHVALRTVKQDVFAMQTKRHAIMIPVMTVRIQTIVAVQTARAEGQNMIGGESLIAFQMAGCTGVLIERPVSVRMAILTRERCAI